MANANPASSAPKPPKIPKESGGPKIEYIGEGAEKIKFSVDPKATVIRVYANGLIAVSY